MPGMGRVFAAEPRTISQRRSGPRRARHPRHRGVGRGRQFLQRGSMPPRQALATAGTLPAPAPSLPAAWPSARAAASWRCGSIPPAWPCPARTLGDRGRPGEPAAPCPAGRWRSRPVLDEQRALAGWAQHLAALSLFVILGPALAAAGWRRCSWAPSSARPGPRAPSARSNPPGPSKPS